MGKRAGSFRRPLPLLVSLVIIVVFVLGPFSPTRPMPAHGERLLAVAAMQTGSARAAL